MLKLPNLSTVCEGSALVIVPQRDLGSLAEEELESELGAVLALFADASLKHAVLDFEQVPYFGSSMISVLLKLWKACKSRGGRMLLCNVSEKEAEILAAMKLHRMWPSYGTREDALKALEG